MAHDTKMPFTFLRAETKKEKKEKKKEKKNKIKSKEDQRSYDLQNYNICYLP